MSRFGDEAFSSFAACENENRIDFDVITVRNRLMVPEARDEDETKAPKYLIKGQQITKLFPSLTTHASPLHTCDSF